MKHPQSHGRKKSSSKWNNCVIGDLEEEKKEKAENSNKNNLNNAVNKNNKLTT